MAAAGLALLLSGCSADLALRRADWNWWSNSRPIAPSSAPPEALVGPDGACAGEAAAPRGVAIGMTECDLIRTAGPTNQIVIGANERGERTAVLTYPEGERAGIYRFTAGLLVSIERLPEPPKPARPARDRRRQPPPRGY